MDNIAFAEEAESQRKKEGFSDRKREGKRSCTGYWNSSSSSRPLSVNA